jgi:hypothetical protein
MRPPLLARAEIDFLQANVLFMFLPDSSPVWSLMMIGRRVMSLAALALCAARPACAQQIKGTGPVSDPAPSMANAASNPGAGSEGIRLTETASFTLLEHGVWQKVPAMVATGAPPQLRASATRPKPDASLHKGKIHSGGRHGSP